MIIDLGGLPRPKAQVRIYDASGTFAGRPDLFYERQRLAIEYDGDVHRSAMTADNRRQNRLLSAGVRLLRFTAADVLRRPDAVVMQVRAMLAAPIAGESESLRARAASFAGEPSEARAG